MRHLLVVYSTLFFSLALGGGPAGSGDHSSVCTDYKKKLQCTKNGCAWTAGSCGDIVPTPPPSPPACSSYTKSRLCTNAGCTWAGRSCVEYREPICADHINKKICERKGCTYDNTDGCVDYRPPACTDLTKGKFCVQAKCHWDKKTKSCGDPVPTEPPVAPACTDITKGRPCIDAGCTWDKPSKKCIDPLPTEPPVAPACTDYTKIKPCRAAGCVWNKVGGCDDVPPTPAPVAPTCNDYGESECDGECEWTGTSCEDRKYCATCASGYNALSTQYPHGCDGDCTGTDAACCYPDDSCAGLGEGDCGAGCAFAEGTCSPECTCPGGTATSGDACPSQGFNLCESCDTGYYMEFGTCKMNKCTCAHGPDPEGADCPTDGMDYCVTCDAEGTYLDPDEAGKCKVADQTCLKSMLTDMTTENLDVSWVDGVDGKGGGYILVKNRGSMACRPSNCAGVAWRPKGGVIMCTDGPCPNNSDYCCDVQTKCEESDCFDPEWRLKKGNIWCSSGTCGKNNYWCCETTLRYNCGDRYILQPKVCDSSWHRWVYDLRGCDNPGLAYGDNCNGAWGICGTDPNLQNCSGYNVYFVKGCTFGSGGIENAQGALNEGAVAMDEECSKKCEARVDCKYWMRELTSGDCITLSDGETTNTVESSDWHNERRHGPKCKLAECKESDCTGDEWKAKSEKVWCLDGCPKNTDYCCDAQTKCEASDCNDDDWEVKTYDVWCTTGTCEKNSYFCCTSLTTREGPPEEHVDVTMPIMESSAGGCLDYATLQNGGEIWCNQAYTFRSLQNDPLAGARLFKGPFGVPDGDVRTFKSGTAGSGMAGTFYALLPTRDGVMRAGTYGTSLGEAGWTKTDIEASSMFRCEAALYCVHDFEVWSLDNDGTADVVLPAAEGGDNFAVFAWKMRGTQIPAACWNQGLWKGQCPGCVNSRGYCIENSSSCGTDCTGGGGSGSDPTPTLGPVVCGGNAAEGAQCVFPFVYNGVTYNECTTANHDQAWCYTDLAKKQWGNCDCPKPWDRIITGTVASASTIQGSNVASNGNDGDLTTRVETKPTYDSKKPAWFQLELPYEADVTRIKLVNVADNCRNRLFKGVSCDGDVDRWDVDSNGKVRGHNTGATIGVGNRPCTEAGCYGPTCKFLTKIRSDHIYTVECPRWKLGQYYKYAWVSLPGWFRTLNFVEMSVYESTDCPYTIRPATAGECPADADVPNCTTDGLEVGSVCEGGGECETDSNLDNCGNYDIYVVTGMATRRLGGLGSMRRRLGGHSGGGGGGRVGGGGGGNLGQYDSNCPANYQFPDMDAVKFGGRISKFVVESTPEAYTRATVGWMSGWCADGPGQCHDSGVARRSWDANFDFEHCTVNDWHASGYTWNTGDFILTMTRTQDKTAWPKLVWKMQPRDGGLSEWCEFDRTDWRWKQFLLPRFAPTWDALVNPALSLAPQMELKIIDATCE